MSTKKMPLPLRTSAGLMLCLSIAFSVGLSLALPSAAHAMTDAELENNCWELGVQKILAEAGTHEGCHIDESQIRIIEISNKWYNPAKYLRLSVATDCVPAGQITQLVQHWRGRCF